MREVLDKKTSVNPPDDENGGDHKTNYDPLPRNYRSGGSSNNKMNLQHGSIAASSPVARLLLLFLALFLLLGGGAVVAFFLSSSSDEKEVDEIWRTDGADGNVALPAYHTTDDVQEELLGDTTMEQQERRLYKTKISGISSQLQSRGFSRSDHHNRFSGVGSGTRHVGGGSSNSRGNGHNTAGIGGGSGRTSSGNNRGQRGHGHGATRGASGNRGRGGRGGGRGGRGWGRGRRRRRRRRFRDGIGFGRWIDDNIDDFNRDWSNDDFRRDDDPVRVGD